VAEGKTEDILNLVPGKVIGFHAEAQAKAFSLLKSRFPQVRHLATGYGCSLNKQTPKRQSVRFRRH